jgi:hypothetical protein
MLAVTASYSAKFLKPCFLMMDLSSDLYLALSLSEKDRSLHHLFHYRRHVLFGGDKSLDVFLGQLYLRDWIGA